MEEKIEGKKIDDEYLKRLILGKIKVKLNCKDGNFYTGTIKGASDIGILFLDKYNSELFFNYEDILRIIPTKDNGNSEVKNVKSNC